MTRRENANSEATEGKAVVRRRVVDFDIQQQLAELQELIYDSFRIPLTAWSVIDEDRILDQIDIVSDSIPEAIQRALAIIEREETIMAHAEEYAQRIVNTAQQEAQRITDETGIIQKAQQEAEQIRYQVQQEYETRQRQTQQECETLQRQTQQECELLQRKTQQECETLQRKVQQECETLQRQTLGELEQIKQVTNQELQQYRQQTLRECQEIQADADKYADQLLGRLEQNLSDMMRVVTNSRQVLYENSPAQTTARNSPPAPPPSASPNSSAITPRSERPRKRR